MSAIAEARSVPSTRAAMRHSGGTMQNSRHSGARRRREPGTDAHRVPRGRAVVREVLAFVRVHGFRAGPCGASRNDGRWNGCPSKSRALDEGVHHLLVAGVLEIDFELVVLDRLDDPVA